MGKKRPDNQPTIRGIRDEIDLGGQELRTAVSSIIGGQPDKGELLLRAAQQELGQDPARIEPGTSPTIAPSLEYMQLEEQYQQLVLRFNLLLEDHRSLSQRAAFLEKQINEHMPELTRPIAFGDEVTLPDGRKMSLADAVSWANAESAPVPTQNKSKDPDETDTDQQQVEVKRSTNIG
jgi:hypothetical protein